MNIPIWPGSSSFFPGETPFGFYDYDYQFQQDADKVARFCALRLGYPIENVELQATNFYTAFEEAVTVYGNELYAYQLRDNYLTLEGASTSSNVNQKVVTPTMAGIVRLSEQYGEEAGVGGNVTWYSGSIPLTASVQTYDLKQWALEQNITGGIEIKSVLYQPLPAVSQLYSPYMGGFAGLGGVPAIGSVGLGYGYGTYTGYLMMPLSFGLQTIQSIEMNNQVGFSNYTFELVNNQLKVFPIPGTGDDGVNLWFYYIKDDDRINSAFSDANGNKINNLSKAPYGNPVYSQINSIGRSWVFEYTLALAKEMLGYVRGKYTQIPIPGAEVTLNQSDLLSSATSTKEALITKLREYFDSTSRQSLLERRAAESTARQQELNQSPMTIYIG